MTLPGTSALGWDFLSSSFPAAPKRLGRQGISACSQITSYSRGPNSSVLLTQMHALSLADPRERLTL